MAKRFMTLLLTVVICLTACLGPAFASEAVQHEVKGTMVIGCTSTLNGGYETDQFGGGTADGYVVGLIHGLSLVENTPEGELIANPTVIKDLSYVDNEDGTRTYTVQIFDDLVFNDGTGITAKNYIAFPLLFSSPLSIAAGCYGTAGKNLDGFKAYNSGETEAFKGIRLIDEYTFSYTLDADHNPFYYALQALNSSTYQKSYPLDYQYWLSEDADIVDTEEGAKFTVALNAEVYSQHMRDTHYRWEGLKTSGPYQVESADIGAQIITLVVNPNYKGDYQGIKPSIEHVVITYANVATMFDSLKTGAISFIDSVFDGESINTMLDIEEEGGFTTSHFQKNGYGKIFFQCDWGPQQFVKVRQAIAHLLDREALIEGVLQGHGVIVGAAYGAQCWMAVEGEEQLEERMNPYTYSPEKAIELLVEDGWVYDEKGNAYVSGIRWKKVTEKEAAYDKRCVTLADGTIMMPLVMDWAAREGFATTEYIDILLCKSAATAQAGMQINRVDMSYPELLKYLNRTPSSGEQYAQPSYAMLNLSTSFQLTYDQTYRFTLDPDLILNNKNRCFDEELDRLSMDMVYGVDPEDRDTYLQTWIDFIVRFNELLPELALYSEEMWQIRDERIKNFNPTAAFTTMQAIVQAYWED